MSRAVRGGKALHGEMIGATLAWSNSGGREAVHCPARLHAIRRRHRCGPSIGLHGVGTTMPRSHAGPPSWQVRYWVCMPLAITRCRRQLGASLKRTAVTWSLRRGSLRSCAGNLEHPAAFSPSSDFAAAPPATASAARIHQVVEQRHDGDVSCRVSHPLAASRPSQAAVRITTAFGGGWSRPRRMRSTS